MKKCPICEIELPDPFPPICSQCGWDLKNDLTFGAFIDLPNSVIEEYERRVEIARTNFNKELRQKKTEPAQAGFPKPENKSSDGKTADIIYSGKTPVPELKKDPFETIEEFEKRINQYPPVPAGTAELIKEQYDIQTGRFPLNVSWEEWINNLKDIPVIQDLYIHVERDTARAIFEAGSRYYVFLSLKADKENAVTDKIELFALNRAIPVISPEKLWTEPVTGMEFVYVPGGTFMMGDIFGDGNNIEKPVHKVRLSSFYMGKYQVTQEQWKKVMGSNPSHFKKGGKYPVENISWHDTQEFINKLSELNHGKYSFHLPTEAQWEYACRTCGQKEKYSGGDNIDAAAWYGSNSGGTTHAAGQKEANGLGIYDMSGNVWELCQDWFGNYTISVLIDPQGPDKGSSRVIRGGSWNRYEIYCRSTFRSNFKPSSRNNNVGFRLVFSMKSSG